MNAFTAIASAENTSLAVVAPGIAEALLATALGLLAAIPAVIAYNKLSSDAGKLVARLDAFADRMTAMLSRQFDAARAD
jgi:biopolymer transport protein TolQ